MGGSGLLPPRSTVDEIREDARASGFPVIHITVTLVTSLAIAAIAGIALMKHRDTPLVIPFFALVVGAGLFLGHAVLLARDRSPFMQAVARLVPGVLGADGEVAAFIDEVQPGPEGSQEAPISKRCCVWAQVSIETRGGSNHKLLRKEWRDEHARGLGHAGPDEQLARDGAVGWRAADRGRRAGLRHPAVTRATDPQPAAASPARGRDGAILVG
jgi:hypothetical protein